MRTIVDQSGSMIYRQTQEIESLRQQLADKQAIIDDWLYANGPNGWIESLRQQLSGANARIELMGETALNQQKREVMLRDALRIANGVLVDNYDLRIPVVTEALDDTADLDGLILCHAEPVGWIGTGPRDGRSEFSESKPANSVMRDFNMKPLYRAWEPK